MRMKMKNENTQNNFEIEYQMNRDANDAAMSRRKHHKIHSLKYS
jgi:hypothetical protein